MSVLEIILLILGILLFLVLLLIFIPLGVALTYKGDFNEIILKIRVGFISVKFNLPSTSTESDKSKKDIAKKEKPKDKQKKNEDKPQQDIPQKAEGVIKKYMPLIKLAPPAIYRLIESITIDKVCIVWHIHTADAAKTAIQVGQSYALLHSVVALITPPFNISLKNVSILPDYVGKNGIDNYATVRISTQLFKLIATALWFLITIKNNNKREKV